MHELSLAQSLLDQLLGHLQEHGAQRIIGVTVVIGPFSGIVADSFSFGFDALKGGQEATRHTTLKLELPDPEYRCRQCHNACTLPRDSDQDLSLGARLLADLVCPSCGASALSPAGGGELVLKTLEME